MLRAKGVPARYVRGTVEVPAATLREMTGTASIEQAVRVLERAGIPHEIVSGTGGVGSVKMERVWAEAYLPYTNYRGAQLDAQGKFWIPLDAGFKRMAPPTGIDVVQKFALDPLAWTDEYLGAPQTVTPLAFARGKITPLLSPGQTYADVLNTRGHLVETLGILPSSLPYKVVNALETSYDLPDLLAHTLHVTGEGIDGGSVIDATLNVPDVLGKRLTLSYVPFSADDAAVADTYGGLAKTPPYLVEVKAVLKSAGLPVAAGSQPIGLGVRFTLRLTLQSLGGAQTIEDRVIAGNLTAIGLGGRTVTGTENESDQAAAILSRLAWRYLDRWNASDDELANLFRVVPVRPTASLCLVASAIDTPYAGGDPLYPLSFDWKGITIDADRRASAPVGIESRDSERSFLLLSGLEGSTLEQRIFEDELAVHATSTADVLGRAHAQGLTVHDLDRSNVDAVLPTLPFDPQVLDEISDAVGRDRRVTVPAGFVAKEAWRGVGYRILDDATGEAAYQLQGGYSGGITTLDPTMFPPDLAEPLAKQGETVSNSPEGALAAHVKSFPSTDFQEQTVNKRLAKDLRVLVTDAQGYAVKGATVIFSAAGGGSFLDLKTNKSTGSAFAAISDERGEATAALVLGKSTAEIPRFFLKDGDDFSTQIGLNLVSALVVTPDGSIMASLERPFEAYGFPDLRSEQAPPGFSKLFTLKWVETSGTTLTLGVAGRTRLAVTDQYDNPISNIQIQLAYDRIEERPPFTPNSTRTRPVTDTHGKILDAETFVKCENAHGSVRWGECEGETETIQVRSSPLGIFAYPILGDSTVSRYYFVAGTTSNPKVLWVYYPTWGPICIGPVGSCYAAPWTDVYGGSRYFYGPGANEGYSLGSMGDITLWTDVLWEEGQVLEQKDSNGKSHFVAVPTNKWHREPLSGSVLNLTPNTDGTSASPDVAAEVLPGVYRSTMLLASTPQKNTVKVDETTYPAVVQPLLDEFGGVKVYGDYMEIAESDVNNDMTPARRPNPAQPYTGSSEFSLWSIDPKITKVDPEPIRLDSARRTKEATLVSVSVEPPAYAAMLDPRQVVFDLRDNEGQTVVAGNNDLHSYTIPGALPLAESSYQARLRVIGVSADGKDVESQRTLNIAACQIVSLEKGSRTVEVPIFVDPDEPSAHCQKDPVIAFSLCRKAKVTALLDDFALEAILDGSGTSRAITDLELEAGPHTLQLDAHALNLELGGRKPFAIRAVDLTDPSNKGEEDGQLLANVKAKTVLPIGRTFVKGVDIFDGHLVQQANDFKFKGRNLGFELTRTYSSQGEQASGVMGAGWAWNYGASLSLSDCGLVSVSTADGGGVIFRSTGDGYEPQKGYHGRLVAADGGFDYFDKGGTRHHFEAQPDAATHGEYRLAYIEEPHKDRLRLAYNSDNLVGDVYEVQDGKDIRNLHVDYKRKGDELRVATVRIESMKVRVDYDYDDKGNLTSAVRKDGLSENADPVRSYSYGYDTTNPQAPYNMTSATDPNGHKTEYVYFKDEDVFQGGEVVKNHHEYVHEVHESPEEGKTVVTKFKYDFSEMHKDAQEGLTGQAKPVVTDGRLQDTSYVLNVHGSPLEIHEPLDRTTKMDWDLVERVKKSEEDPLHRVTEYKYEDGRGNLTKEIVHATDGDVTTQYAYHPIYNKLTQKIDAENRTYTYNIDDIGDLTYQIDGTGRTDFNRDGHGQLTSRMDPAGNTTHYSGFDNFGNPREATSQAGVRTTFGYDPRGHLVTEKDTLGHDRTYVYNAIDQMIRVIRRPGGQGEAQITQSDYYPGGQPKLVTEQGGAVTSYTLDGMNRVVTKTTTGPGLNLHPVEMKLDANGNMEEQTDTRGVHRKFVYDELNRLKTAIILDGPSDGPVGSQATFSYEYDIVGNKKSETDHAGLITSYDLDGLYRVHVKHLPEAPYTEVYGYDKVGNRTSVKDANGHETKYQYDAANRVIDTENALGQHFTVTYRDPNGTGHLNKSEERDLTRGLRTTYTYDGDNRELTRTVRLEGAGGGNLSYLTRTTYDDPAHSYRITDPNGGVTRVKLDGVDHVIEKAPLVDGAELLTKMKYDRLGYLKETTDPRGNVTRTSYDALGRLVETTDALGHSSSASYDGGGLVLTQTDRRHVRKTMTYDNLGRLTHSELTPSITNVGWSQDIEYQDRARKRIETDARGKQTTYLLDGLGRPLTITDARGKSAFMGYDGVNKRSETDRRGHKTTFDYDDINRLTTTTDPAPFQAQTVTTVYQDAQNKKTVTDRRGIATVTQMDPLGRVLTVTRDGVAMETNSYDGNGNKVLGADGEGKQTRFEYDAANRLRARTMGFGSPAASTVTLQYDKAGNLEIERDARAASLNLPFSTKKTYDAVNRVASETNGAGETVTYGYDEEGNRTSVRENTGQTTSFDYDEMGKLVSVTQPGNIVTSYEYDRNRNRTKQTDANHHVVTMEYDALNRLSDLTQDPSGFHYVTHHDYDPNGNETQLTDPKGQTVTSTYDELNRLTQKIYGLASGDHSDQPPYLAQVDYDHDANGNVTQTKEYVTSGNSPPGPVTSATIRTYDNLERLDSETVTRPGTSVAPQKVSYTYFKNGTRKSVQDPFQQGTQAATQYSYDGQNRLQMVTTADGRRTAYTYFLDGLTRTVAYPNGVVATSNYDNADRLISLNNANGGTLVSSYNYIYDTRGNRIRQQETNGGAPETTLYTYDDLNRLKTITYPPDDSFPSGRTLTYTYDDVGNRKEEVTTVGGVVVNRKVGAFNALNHLDSLTENDGSGTVLKTTGFQYDADGNTVSKTTNGATTATYVYDVRDKQIEVHQGGFASSYAYDADGRLSFSSDDQGVKYLVYDQTSRFLELNASGVGTGKYDYGNRLIRLTQAGEGQRFYSYDGLGSATALTDETAFPKVRLHLDAWGVFKKPSELDATQNRVGFTGYFWSKSTNLYFAKARWYDPETARFTTQDSYVGKTDDPPSLHKYLYAVGNPTRYIDPTGHNFEVLTNWQYAEDGTPYVDPARPEIPHLFGNKTSADLDAFNAWVDKNGTEQDRQRAIALNVGVRSTAYVEGVAKLEAAGVAGAVAAAPVAIAGGGAVAVGAVGGGVSGGVSGWLDGLTAKGIAIRAATGAALGAAFGWVADKVGSFLPEETGVAQPGAATKDRLVDIAHDAALQEALERAAAQTDGLVQGPFNVPGDAAASPGMKLPYEPPSIRSYQLQGGSQGAESSDEVRERLIDALRFRARSLELGFDPTRGQTLVREGIGATRFERAMGRTVTRSLDPAVDYIDPKIGPFDLKGPLLANDGTPIAITDERVAGLAQSALDEANFSSASKAVVVDALGLDAAQVASLKNTIVEGLTSNKPVIILE